MVRVSTIYVLCEGHTEKAFVSTLLAPHLKRFHKIAKPILLRTSQDESRRGGMSKYSYIKAHIADLLAQSRSDICVTTMIDYYGLPSDFPGKAELRGSTPYERVKYLEEAFSEDIRDERFYPYLMLHEFEALVLAQPEKIAESLPLDSQSRQSLKRLIKEISRYASSEEINDGANTHPSARLEAAIPGYQKVLHGMKVVQATGLGVLRERCPHFGEWIAYLERV